MEITNEYLFYHVFQIIEELEERIIKISQIQNVKCQKEISKMKLKYEIMARNQVNQRLSEMNEFLSEQQKEHDQDERKKADVTDAIQKDLAKRLQISRDELIAIKQEMRGKYDNVKRDSVYGIKFKLMPQMYLHINQRSKCQFLQAQKMEYYIFKTN